MKGRPPSGIHPFPLFLSPYTLNLQAMKEKNSLRFWAIIQQASMGSSPQLAAV